LEKYTKFAGGGLTRSRKILLLPRLTSPDINLWASHAVIYVEIIKRL